MSDAGNRERARRPEDLSRLFLERANAGDADGLVALYEDEALLVGRNDEILIGTEAIRRFYRALLSSRPTFSGETQQPLQRGDLSLTSTRFTTGTGRAATAEVARRQLDGTWLWAIDKPNVVA